MRDETSMVTVGAVTFAAGLLLGIAAGVLLAPHSGAYTRRQLQNLAEELHEGASLLAREAKGVVDEALEHGKRLAS